MFSLAVCSDCLIQREGNRNDHNPNVLQENSHWCYKSLTVIHLLLNGFASLLGLEAVPFGTTSNLQSEVSEPRCCKNQTRQTCLVLFLQPFRQVRQRLDDEGNQSGSQLYSQAQCRWELYKELRSAYEETTQHLNKDLFFHCSATAIVKWGNFVS